MKFIVLLAITLLPFLNSQNKQKLCIDCKFYTKNFFTFSEFGKCSLFATKNEDTNYLVNGKKSDNLDDYHYCATARKFDHMCGKEGKFFEKK
jgi:hypothetical protein